jgi:hypothetical protein
MITGSGHLLEESLALAGRLPDVDLLLSKAAEEVLEIYGLRLEDLRQRFRVIRDKTASAVPVGLLYDHHYHTVVIAPATSNTVAKCAMGISDSLPSNMLAQSGKLGIPGHRLRLRHRACGGDDGAAGLGEADAPEHRTAERGAPARDRPRARCLLHRGASRSPGAAARRMQPAMEHIVFLTGRLAEKALDRVLHAMAPAPFTWQVREIGIQVAGLMTADLIRRRLVEPLHGGSRDRARTMPRRPREPGSAFRRAVRARARRR